MKITTLHRGGPGYPERLARLDEKCPSTICVGGHLSFDTTIAIVGARAATKEARGFVRKLAAECVTAGAVIVSGGAEGIDEAAHVGAWEANGATWVVWGHGSAAPFPQKRAEFAARACEEERVSFIHPFEPKTTAQSSSYKARNGVLVALADVVVIVEAERRSGTWNTYSWTQRLRHQSVWAVPVAPWAENSSGTLEILRAGAKPLGTIAHFLDGVRLRPLPASAARPLPEMDLLMRHVFDQVGTAPTHVDFIVERSRMATSTVATTLLTLALEHVLVEGPPGHYRRA